MTTQPACAASGAYLSEIEAPAENRPMGVFEKSNVARSWTVSCLPRNAIFLPAERSLASG